jgi:two-component system CheB/CheR fusion protein
MNRSDCEQESKVLLNYLQQNCDRNLKDSQPIDLMRRVQYRMQQLEIENYSQYLQYLQNRPQELTFLIDAISIDAVGLVNECDSWDYLANNIIPKIITSKQPQERIRVWCAGCGIGQEVYRLSVLLVEALGMEQYLQKVQIFATDIDENALNQGRQGIYSNLEIADIPSKFLSKYCEQTEQVHVFNYQLRRSIIFGYLDLVNNAPISKIDLLICRNVLNNFDSQTQANILFRLHFALVDSGFLCVGQVENLTNDRQFFIPVSMKHLIFAKAENLTLQEQLLIRPQPSDREVPDPVISQIIHFWQAAFQTSPLAQFAVDRRGRPIGVSNRAYTLFGLKEDDLGARVQDLQFGQVANLEVLMEQLNRDRREIHQKNVQLTTSHGRTYFDIYITPIIKPNGSLLGANITFIDVTNHIKLEKELKSSNSQLTKVCSELELTKKRLSSANAELERTQQSFK